jgi:hypothetical protein
MSSDQRPPARHVLVVAEEVFVSDEVSVVIQGPPPLVVVSPGIEVKAQTGQPTIQFGRPAPRSRPAKIERPPGVLLARFADFVFPKRIRDHVLIPHIADTQSEYFEALNQGRTRKAWWIAQRGRLTFVQLVVTTAGWGLMRALFGDLVALFKRN